MIGRLLRPINWYSFLKKVGVLGCAVILLSSLSGWVVNGQTRGGTLNIGVDQEAVGLDPNLVTSLSSFDRIDLLYNTLVKYTPDLKIVPELAESWETPNDKTYIIHLRKGVKFQNGQELTANDVAYTLERIINPKVASPAQSYLKSISTVKVIDKYTLQVNFTAPLPSFLDALASANVSIVPADVVKAKGNLQREAVGTGPFMLKEWVPGDHMTLVRNPNYFRNGLPYLDKVVFHVIPDQASLLAGLRTGSLDMAKITDGALIQQALSDPTLKVIQVPGINLRTFGFNCTRKPFNDYRVRQAISWALDRQQIVNAAAFGFGTVSGPFIIAAKRWAVPPADLPAYTTNLDKARELLKEAGYPNGFSFNILCSPTYEGGLKVAEVIQAQLKKIGLDPKIESVEWGTYINKWVKRDFDSIVELRGGGTDPDRFLYRIFHTGGAANNFLFSNKEVDNLLEQGRVTTDYAKRKAIYDKLQILLAEQAPMIALYSPMVTVVEKSYAKGFELIPTGSLRAVEHTWLSSNK